MSEEEADETALFPERIGDRLRAARAKAGLDLSDIAARTRVPLRHLTALEAGDYASLPAPTYSIGFVKSFARALGMDENEAAGILRDEMGHRTINQRLEAPDYEEEESGPLAPRWLAWTAFGLALLAALGYAAVKGDWFSGSSTPTEAVAPSEEETVAETQQTATPPAQPAQSANPQGQVVLTAKGPVWMRIYDANNKVLIGRELAAGESFTVPSDTNKPMIRTGAAQLLTVTVDGKEVAPLGPADRTIKDVEISAQALTARAAAAPAPGAAAPAAGVAPAVQNNLTSPAQP